MARKDILPSYLSQQPWRDMLDAVDVVFSQTVDEPTKNLAKLRRSNPLRQSAKDKIEAGQLFTPADLEYFENEVLIRQLNALGLHVSDQGYYTPEQLQLMMRNIARFWYSKGTGNVADFLSYVLNTTVTMTQLWTNDYVTFLPVGDPGIGTPVYLGGTWYPTTHTDVVILDPPGGIPAELLMRLLVEVVNYPLVIRLTVNVNPILIITNTGNVPLVGMGIDEATYDFIYTFSFTGAEESTEQGGGGYTAITGIAIPGPGGTGWTPQTEPVGSDFTADYTSGPAPLVVTFVPTTGDVSEASWDFNNDGTIDSHELSPTFSYSTPGTYTVRMYALNSAGTAQITKTDYITVT